MPEPTASQMLETLQTIPDTGLDQFCHQESSDGVTATEALAEVFKPEVDKGSDQLCLTPNDEKTATELLEPQ